jgi:protein-disulfide isomerase
MHFSVLPSNPGRFLPRIAIALLATAIPAASAQAAAPQQDLPAAPAQSTAAPATLNFAKPDPANFTADKPTVAEVDAFLKATWGYNADLAWQVEQIAKTPTAGVSKVTVAIGQKSNPSQVGSLVFFTMPDGQHIISQDDMVPFGARPFEEHRKLLEAEANGPARGSASKDLMLVEFADFQCPHCKDAQPTMDNLAKDFPKARIVYESFPLPQHSEAGKAAAYGVCVQKTGGDAAFFKFAESVFANQAALTPEGSTEALNKAVADAGLDSAKVAACSTSPVGIDGVKASLGLANKLGVHETPTLYINGRGVPIGGIQYDQLKAIIAYQAAQDGVPAAATSGQ